MRILKNQHIKLKLTSPATRALCDSDGGSEAGEGEKDNSEMITMIHGIMASIAWVFLFPVGAILVRVIKSNNAWWIHASIQMLTVLVITASAATGIILADRKEEVCLFLFLRKC